MREQAKKEGIGERKISKARLEEREYGQKERKRKRLIERERQVKREKKSLVERESVSELQ